MRNLKFFTLENSHCFVNLQTQAKAINSISSRLLRFSSFWTWFSSSKKFSVHLGDRIQASAIFLVSPERKIFHTKYAHYWRFVFNFRVGKAIEVLWNRWQWKLSGTFTSSVNNCHFIFSYLREIEKIIVEERNSKNVSHFSGSVVVVKILWAAWE